MTPAGNAILRDKRCSGSSCETCLTVKRYAFSQNMSILKTLAAQVVTARCHQNIIGPFFAWLNSRRAPATRVRRLYDPTSVCPFISCGKQTGESERRLNAVFGRLFVHVWNFRFSESPGGRAKRRAGGIVLAPADLFKNGKATLVAGDCLAVHHARLCGQSFDGGYDKRKAFAENGCHCT